MQTKLEKTLARYVAMPTLTNDVPICRAAIKSISLELEKIGMVTRIDGPNHPWLIATPTRAALQKKHVKVLFVIHFDVVPLAHEGQLKLEATKDKLFGRGVYDMKFAAACVKEMAASFAAKNELKDYDFGILITTDEEKGGIDGAREFLERGWTADIAVVPDGGWNWSIEARAKGFIYVYIRANGRAAHSSRPWTGDNPISRISPTIDAITKNFLNTDPLGTIVSINSIESSNSGIFHTTQIPTWAKAGISVRAYTDAEMLAAVEFIKATAASHNVETEVTLHDAPVALDKDNKLVQQFIATAAEVHGEPIKTSDALAASDARYFAGKDIPTVVMYPNGGDHHGPQEWILRSDLEKYYQLCKTFVERVTKNGMPVKKPSGFSQLLKALNRR